MHVGIAGTQREREFEENLSFCVGVAVSSTLAPLFFAVLYLIGRVSFVPKQLVRRSKEPTGGSFLGEVSKIEWKLP